MFMDGSFGEFALEKKRLHGPFRYDNVNYLYIQMYFVVLFTHLFLLMCLSANHCNTHAQQSSITPPASSISFPDTRSICAKQ
jgi:hypothetical protein